MPKVEAARYRCGSGHESSSSRPKKWQRCPIAGCGKIARLTEDSPPPRRAGQPPARVSAQSAPAPPETPTEADPTVNQPAPEPPGSTKRPSPEEDLRAAHLLGPF